MRTLDRGEVVLAPDPHKDGRRPFVIISDSDYPFYPHGYLGLPVTTRDRPNTWQIHERDKVYVNDGLHVNPSYINPWSPSQINEVHKTLLKLDKGFMDMLAADVSRAIGVNPE